MTLYLGKNKKSFIPIFLFVFLLHSTVIVAVEDSTETKPLWSLDTNYVKKYPDKLIIGLYYSWRYYDLKFIQNLTKDPKQLSNFNYIARGNNSIGFSAEWDKLYISYFHGLPQADRDTHSKGKTYTLNLGFSYSSRRFRLEGSYRRYTGFFDNQTPIRDPNFEDNRVFFQQPEMISKEMRLKGFYFLNRKKRFSYGATFGNAQRQLKSSGSFVFVSSIYRYNVFNDDSFLPPGTEQFYPGLNDWNYLRALGVSFSAGGSYNLVFFKRFMTNLTITWGTYVQHQNYTTNKDKKSISDWDTGFAPGDLRGSIGYNGDRFFLMFNYIGEYTIYELNRITINSQLLAGGLTLGYRFDVKDSKTTRWIKNNKLYQLL